MNLTPRLREILQLKLNGLDNAGIAEVLGISPKTVECQVSQIIQELGAEGPWNAAGIAIREGVAKVPAK